MPNSQDIEHMRRALALAQARLGRTWPNPSVGAVVVKDGAVVGEAATARGGRPHAETQALAQAGEQARGATLYVTLEPCSHHGKTPPCAEAVIAAGIKRVVVATADPNPKVAGRGLAMLRAAGIEVMEGVCEAEAQALNEGFFSVMARARPFVTLKIATSSDDRITTGDAGKRWITGEASREEVHRLRAEHDAILTGIGTVLADDPALTCRLPGREADSPQRVVMDSHLRIPLGAKVLPAWVMTSQQALAGGKAEALRQKEATLFAVAHGVHGLYLPETLMRLAHEGVTRLMVEAGATLSAAFLHAGFVDRLYWFRAPLTVGDKGMKLALQEALAPMRRQRTQMFGEDVLEVYDAIPTLVKGR